ncbi:MAG: terminase small subunit [Burkholderiales bacterium]
MRLNKRNLAEKLGVSETTLTTWQRKGMPVLEHGRRGKDGVYDLTAVVMWIGDTGSGLFCRAGPRVDIEKLRKECGLIKPLDQPPVPAPPFPDPRTISAIEQATGDSLVEAAAWAVHLFNLQPKTAIYCAQIFAYEQASVFEDVHGFGTAPFSVAGDSRMLLEDGGLKELVARVEHRAGELAPGDVGVYEDFFDEDEFEYQGEITA